MGFVSSASNALMILINFVFAMMGASLFVVGVLVLNDTKEFKDFIEHGFFSIPALLMVVGTIVGIIFCFGALGAFSKSSYMMMMFSLVLGLVFVLEIGGLLASYLLRGKTEESFQKAIEENFKTSANDTENRKLWDNLQTLVECCGANSYMDYKTLFTTAVPESCCKAEFFNCTTSNITQIYTNGCGIELKGILVSNASLMIKWISIVAAVHFIWVCMGCYLSKSFRTRGYESV